LIAGKGHEDYQEINGVKQPFSDSEVVRRALKRMGSGIKSSGMDHDMMLLIASGKYSGRDCHRSRMCDLVRYRLTAGRLARGDLFLALQGERFDGGEYVSGAVESGAVAALVNKVSYHRNKAVTHGEATPCPLLLVEDTRLALGQLAAYWRKQFDIPLVGITGSNGKTTVKEMLGSILREHAGDTEAVLVTKGNLNNDIGMPLTLA
jgi:UDP-N-acetylmuramyl tripeptide synthase